MAGIYIHIPYCKQVCYYCDFHFSVSLKHKQQMIDAIIEELKMQKVYLGSLPVKTLYFGGGTPSLLDIKDVDKILSCVSNNYNLINDPEITFEVNPDDLTVNYLYNLRQAGVSRLSIGIQSFTGNVLKFLNRRHTSKQSYDAIRNSFKAGYENVSIDIMYGIPGMDEQIWQKELEQSFQMGIHHLSAYHLTIEPKTVFGNYLKKNKIIPVNEKDSLLQYKALIDCTADYGFFHYEISNFAKPGYVSIHNSNYWKGKYYLGVGPSAHSYNGETRQWNVSVNADYITAIKSGIIPCKKEFLSNVMKLNDYLLTSLRTMWGIDLDYIKKVFGQIVFERIIKDSKYYINKGLMKSAENKLFLTNDGMFMADALASDLMENPDV